ncbi:hypothetical protein M885DRAFT_603086 [Pelagophyceae sp. CCMP2097]|nr:hypothetical protein M885DRAFT_603086 [Pelagophyceae sp. CCMP2097]
MEVSVGGLKKAVDKFLLEWLTKFDADEETHYSGDHDKATESMSEWQRLCHDCAWHMKDAERAKEKKGEEKTETDVTTRRVSRMAAVVRPRHPRQIDSRAPRMWWWRLGDQSVSGMIPSGMSSTSTPRPRLRPLDTTITEATWAASAASSIFSSPVVSAASSSGAIPKATCGL